MFLCAYFQTEPVYPQMQKQVFWLWRHSHWLNFCGLPTWPGNLSTFRNWHLFLLLCCPTYGGRNLLASSLHTDPSHWNCSQAFPTKKLTLALHTCVLGAILQITFNDLFGKQNMLYICRNSATWEKRMLTEARRISGVTWVELGTVLEPQQSEMMMKCSSVQ